MGVFIQCREAWTVRPQNTGDTCARGVTKVIRAANEHRVDEGQ
jgi:hypothetical protein